MKIFFGFVFKENAFMCKIYQAQILCYAKTLELILFLKTTARKENCPIVCFCAARANAEWRYVSLMPKLRITFLKYNYWRAIVCFRKSCTRVNYAAANRFSQLPKPLLICIDDEAGA